MTCKGHMKASTNLRVLTCSREEARRLMTAAEVLPYAVRMGIMEALYEAEETGHGVVVTHVHKLDMATICEILGREVTL